jgi:hypothetical protein
VYLRDKIVSLLFGKTYLWMLYREVIANYYKNHPEYINVLCGQKQSFCVITGGMYTNHYERKHMAPGSAGM